MEKIFKKQNIKIFNWILLIISILIFEFGYCNCEFTVAKLTHIQSDGFFFSICRGFVYISALIGMYFINKSKIIEEIEETFKNKTKKTTMIVYLIIAILAFIIYTYKFLIKQELSLIQYSVISLILITGFTAIEYLSNKYYTNIISIFLISIIFCINVNAYHTLDEKKHFMSAYNLSYGNINYAEPKVDKQFMEELPRGTHYTQFYKFFKTKYKYQEGKLPEEATVDSTPATYNPILYTPSALGILIGRILQGSVADIFLMGRIFNLFAYMALIILTIKILPYKKNIFLAMMTIPIILCFSATYSIDGIGIGLVSVFIAYCLKLYKDKENITLKQLIILATIYTLMLTFKSMSYIFVGILVFLLPLKKLCKEYKWKIPLIIIGFILINLLVLLIQPKVNLTDNRYEDVDAKKQIINTIEHPLIILDVMEAQIKDRLLNFGWLKDFCASDYLSTTTNSLFTIMFVYYFYVAFKDDSINFGIKEKIIFLLAFFLTFGFTSGILYISCTPIGAIGVGGYQTRYIFPTVTLIMICLSNKTLKSQQNENTLLKISSIQVLFTLAALIGATLK